jgi:hypothetical protein
MDNQPEPYVYADAVAAHLGNMSPLTIKQWARTGKIPGRKPGKYWLFKISEVDAELAKPQENPWAQSPQSRGRRSAAAIKKARWNPEWEVGSRG